MLTKNFSAAVLLFTGITQGFQNQDHYNMLAMPPANFFVQTSTATPTYPNFYTSFLSLDYPTSGIFHIEYHLPNISCCQSAETNCYKYAATSVAFFDPTPIATTAALGATVNLVNF